jgi:phosphoglycolate phosphatase-like HAD superfamily hydrolase
LAQYFHDIFGSPRSKDDILNDMKACGMIKLPAVFLGDSRYDMEVALKFGFDPLFIRRYSEFEGAVTFLVDRAIVSVEHLGELQKEFRSQI